MSPGRRSGGPTGARCALGRRLCAPAANCTRCRRAAARNRNRKRRRMKCERASERASEPPGWPAGRLAGGGRRVRRRVRAASRALFIINHFHQSSVSACLSVFFYFCLCLRLCSSSASASAPLSCCLCLCRRRSASSACMAARILPFGAHTPRPNFCRRHSTLGGHAKAARQTNERTHGRTSGRRARNPNWVDAG